MKIRTSIAALLLPFSNPSMRLLMLPGASRPREEIPSGASVIKTFEDEFGKLRRVKSEGEVTVLFEFVDRRGYLCLHIVICDRTSKTHKETINRTPIW